MTGQLLLWPSSLAPVLSVVVPGKPRAQGSMTLWRDDQGNERAKYAAPVVAHRNLVVGALVAAWRGQAPLTGPVLVSVRLSFPRPRAHYRTGRYSDQLRPDAPELHTQYPDLDKCLRLVFDALTVAGVWADDKQACDVTGGKRWGATGATHIQLLRRDAP